MNTNNRQFLNMKLRWNVDYYRILDFDKEKHIPIDNDWWGTHPLRSARSIELYHQHPFKLSLKESLQNEVEVLPAWIDFRIDKLATDTAAKLNKSLSHEQKSDTGGDSIRFALIRLRVNRNPMYFVANIVFPFFIIVTCSFSTFFVGSGETGDRLSVSVTILLTFTAFQTIISEELPQTSAMLLIDYYIGFAYLMQFLLVLGTCVASVDNGTDWGDVTGTFDIVLGGILGIIWICFSFFYMSLHFKTFRSCYDKLTCSCCCLGSANFNDWEGRAYEELQQWANDDSTKHHSKIFREDLFLE